MRGRRPRWLDSRLRLSTRRIDRRCFNQLRALCLTPQPPCTHPRSFVYVSSRTLFPRRDAVRATATPSPYILPFPLVFLMCYRLLIFSGLPFSSSTGDLLRHVVLHSSLREETLSWRDRVQAAPIPFFLLDPADLQPVCTLATRIPASASACPIVGRRSNRNQEERKQFHTPPPPISLLLLLHSKSSSNRASCTRAYVHPVSLLLIESYSLPRPTLSDLGLRESDQTCTANF